MNIALTNYDVTALDAQERESVRGGSDFSYAVGYTFALMRAHPVELLSNAWNFYF